MRSRICTMKLPQLSPTTKIANYFLLLALITVGIVGGVAYFRARQALQQAAFNRLHVAATLKEEEINRWFEDQQRDFLLTTQMSDVQANLKILLNSEVAAEHQQAYAVLSRYLRRVNQIKPSLQEIFILDRSNKIVLSTNLEREGDYEILANITYVEEVEQGANFAPIFYVSPLTGKPVITLAKPFSDRSGIILVDLNLARIDSIVRAKTGLGATGEAYLVGSLISKNSFIAGKSADSSTFPDGIDSAAIDAAMSGMSGYGLYRNYNGSSVLGVYRWLNEQDIALLVEINQHEAFAPARQLAVTIVLVGLVSVLGLLIGVNWLSRQLYLSRLQLEASSQQLKLKAREAEAANRAKSLFLANMSHELRTPLNAILGFSQLMARTSTLTPEQQEFLGIINRSGEHLLNLINDVLEMSKIEAGKIILNPEFFDLHRLLRTIQEMFRIKAEAKNLWFKFVLAPDLPQYVIGDARKLRQLLINLLSNAVKFTSSGGVTLKATICKDATPLQVGVQGLEETSKDKELSSKFMRSRCPDRPAEGKRASSRLRILYLKLVRSAANSLGRPQASAKSPQAHQMPQELPTTVSDARKPCKPSTFARKTNYDVPEKAARLCFEVSDTGKGIAPEELDKLFNPFVQTASGIQSEGGTGLGLAISRQFVELMGGTIQITSLLGVGSTFTFDIQVQLAESCPVDLASPTRKVKHLAPGQPNYRIAVVDDRQTNRQMLVELLHSVGFEPRTANNGKDAIALWQEWQPDLIWMDMRMPIMDGYEAARQIKRKARDKGTIIIALTASAFEEHKEQMLAAGCDDFVSKPVSERIIFEKMAQYLGVEYIYETASEPGVTSSSTTISTPSLPLDLSCLSPELIAELHQAAIAVDAEQIEQLIEAIPSSQEHITQAISEMIRHYDFDAIIDLTEAYLS